MRHENRQPNELRPLNFTRHFTKYAEGSVLVEFGNTKVLCNASVKLDQAPRFLKGTGQGWVTAEYSMLPRATGERTDREAARGQQGGRTLEIQRLISRALRSMVDLKKLGEHSIIVDCDVIQADGGTRTASISGACVALIDALNFMKDKKIFSNIPLVQLIGSVSVGICESVSLLDLDYKEDSRAETDMNVVMNETGGFVEIQGTAEKNVFSAAQMTEMVGLASQGISTIIKKQREVLGI